MNLAYFFIVQTKSCLKITLGDYIVKGFLIPFLTVKPTVKLVKMFKITDWIAKLYLYGCDIIRRTPSIAGSEIIQHFTVIYERVTHKPSEYDKTPKLKRVGLY